MTADELIAELRAAVARHPYPAHVGRDAWGRVVGRDPDGAWDIRLRPGGAGAEPEIEGDGAPPFDDPAFAAGIGAVIARAV